MMHLLDLPLIHEYRIESLSNNAMHDTNKYIMELIVITELIIAMLITLVLLKEWVNQ